MARSTWQNEFFGSWLPENRGKERKGHIAEIPFKGAYLETQLLHTPNSLWLLTHEVLENITQFIAIMIISIILSGCVDSVIIVLKYSCLAHRK